jgi:hypothetical protein
MFVIHSLWQPQNCWQYLIMMRLLCMYMYDHFGDWMTKKADETFQKCDVVRKAKKKERYPEPEPVLEHERKLKMRQNNAVENEWRYTNCSKSVSKQRNQREERWRNKIHKRIVPSFRFKKKYPVKPETTRSSS